MDRNDAVQIVIVVMDVALRKESVDRNCKARRSAAPWSVALRKESVDRNGRCLDQREREPQFALRKESVDRNCISGYLVGVYFGRSPQGERG